MEFNFQKLAEETLNLGLEITQKSEAKEVETSQSSEPEETVNDLRSYIPEPPIGAGLIFKIEFGSGTFCLRGVASNNLREDYHSLFSGSDYIVKELNIQSEEALKEIQFIPLSHFDLACLVEDQLMNKRIPYAEELICNISDPGFNWWLDLRYPGIKIYFHSFSVDQPENFVKLGPLGDSFHTSAMINSVIEYLSYMMPIDEFSCTDKVFTLSSQNETHPCFQKLKALFRHGASFYLKDFSSLDCVELDEFQHFCHQLSAMRRVWMKVEQIVKEKRRDV